MILVRGFAYGLSSWFFIVFVLFGVLWFCGVVLCKYQPLNGKDGG